MRIKAVALDLDGTLLTEDKKITKLTKEVLKEMEKKGIRVYLVTGRTYVSAKPFADELGLNSVIVTYNGAKVVDYRDDRILFEQPLEEKYTKTIIKMAKDKNIHVNLYQDNKWYVEDPDNEEALHYASFTGLTPVKKDFDSFDDYAMTKITIQDMDNSDTFNDLCNEIERMFGTKVYTAKSQDYLFEILNKNVNKGIVLRRVLESEGIRLNDCVAFGDALNDLEMLTEVGYGVAMGNSPVTLKKRVRYVTDTNDNNGVAKFLKKYFYD
ncbi:Cof-type HAD-IIB family hydrolase [Fusobacterium sp.]|uniref:Cof-type HAD-IIB family hydrolase n=1 Tax=Fusobacterium sp. TaxID=68766 RepID=UPI00396CA522